MTTLPELVTRYAERFHQGQDAHHVGSALGAWMLLASASSGVPQEARGPLEEILGTSVEHASELVAGLLENPHPAVVSAMALWVDKDRTDANFLEEWQTSLPTTVEVGGVPTVQAADHWVEEKTLGLIPKCPVEPTTDTLAILLNTLATKVSWRVPFESVDVWESSTWKDITRILHTTGYAKEDAQLARVDGREYGVNIQRSKDGVVVLSVLGDENESAQSVLAAAHRIGNDLLGGTKESALSLFDVDTTSTNWTITEDTLIGNGPLEVGESYLVAWEATTEHKLNGAALGLAQAGREVLGRLTSEVDVDAEVVQSATARFDRTGFEAAAATAMHLYASASFRMDERPRRTLRLDFTRPYAVVAYTQKVWEARSITAEAWDGVPVFAAWVTEAIEAAEN